MLYVPSLFIFKFQSFMRGFGVKRRGSAPPGVLDLPDRLQRGQVHGHPRQQTPAGGAREEEAEVQSPGRPAKSL